MSKVFIKLDSATVRYNSNGQMFEAGKVYSVQEATALRLLKNRDQYGRNYFRVLSDLEVKQLLNPSDTAIQEEPKVDEEEVVETAKETSQEAEKLLREQEVALEEREFEQEGPITDPSIEVLGSDKSETVPVEDEPSVEV